MRIQRITALFTAAALAFCCFPQRVHAAAALDLEVGRATAEAQAGETVKVPVTAKTNPGYGSGVINVNWDSDALTLTNVEFSAERAPDNGSAEIISDGSYCLSFGDDYATENFTGTGTFFTLTFEVAASAGAGDYMIFLDQADVIDKDIKRIDVTQTAGVVTLTGDAVNPAALTMEIGSAEATLGDDTEVSVPVKAVKNPGYIVGFADLTWNPEVLTLSEIVYADKVPNAGSAAINNSGWYRIAFGNFIAAKNYTEIGDMFTLVFTVNVSAAAGEYEIMLGNLQVENFAEASVPATVKAGAVKLKEKAATTTSTTMTSTTTTTTTQPTTTSTTTTTTSTSSTSKATTTTTSSTTASTTKPTTTFTTTTKASTTTTSSTTASTTKPTTTSTTTTKASTTATSSTTASTTKATTTSTTTTKASTTTTSSTATSTTKATTTSTTTTTKASTTTTSSTTASTTKATTTSTTTTKASTTTSTTTTKATTTTTASTTTTTSTASSTTETSTTESASDTTTTETSTTSTTETASETSSTSSTSAETTTVSESSTSTTASTTETESTESTTTTSQTTTASTTEEPVSTTTTETTPSQPDDYDLGDVNEDGKVDAKDASMVLVAYAKVSTGSEDGLTEKQRKAADVNSDGKVDAKDASSILAYYALVSTASGDIPTMKEFMAPKKA